MGAADFVQCADQIAGRIVHAKAVVGAERLLQIGGKLARADHLVRRTEAEIAGPALGRVGEAAVDRCRVDLGRSAAVDGGDQPRRQ